MNISIWQDYVSLKFYKENEIGAQHWKGYQKLDPFRKLALFAVPPQKFFPRKEYTKYLQFGMLPPEKVNKDD